MPMAVVTHPVVNHACPDRYERRVLDGVANKLEVDLPPRAELDRATNQLRGIKDRRRKQ